MYVDCTLFRLYRVLTTLRNLLLKRLHVCLIIQQSCFRGYRDSARFRIMRYLTIKIQCFVRSHQARRELKQLKRDEKEKMVQRNKREMKVQRLRKELWKGDKMKCRMNQKSDKKEHFLHDLHPQPTVSHGSPNSPHSVCDMR
jgi:hypothetical protein